MNKKGTKYICFEGGEGVGKTTQAKRLAHTLEELGYSVILTKEPGTPHLPITQTLRKIMLSGEFAGDLTPLSRELIAQAIRSIHMEKLIEPNLGEYDYIIQDRGIISGLVYACSLEASFNNKLQDLSEWVSGHKLKNIYDLVIYLEDDVSKSLERAKEAKQEFRSGDFIETQALEFHQRTQGLFNEFLNKVPHHKITIDSGYEGVEKTFDEIWGCLMLEEMVGKIA